LLRFILHRVGDPTVAEDLLQDVFVRMLVGLPQYEERGYSIGAWLYRIAACRVIDWLRLNGRRRISSLNLALELVGDGWPDGEDTAADRETEQHVLAAALAQLTERQATVIRLRFFAELPIVEIAARLGLTPQAVKALQQRLIALHNLDCPWRPGDLEQRHGRILRQGNQWPAVYVFSYITEGSFDAFMFQGIESKARFIEQAMAGEITTRTIEDTSDVVLSAAEIKAIASGNPQIVRKVQLEAEVARLEQVRSVWLDTRRNLQVERHFTEEEIRRVEGRCRQWEQAEQIISAHPHEPFRVDARSTMGAETFKAFTGRQEAGAAVRRLVHEYQSAAAFQRQRLRGAVAHYRGLHLVVQAHAVFAADLSLTLPDGTTLDTVTASTDVGVWQSVGHTVNEIPTTLQRLRGRIKQAQQRITTIDYELARLEQWDGQPTYDTAVSELSAINAAFAAEEERERAERAGPAAQGEDAPTSQSEASPPTPAAASEEVALADVLLALARQERADDGWNAPPIPFPPATESLAWMAAEVERMERGTVRHTPGQPERLEHAMLLQGPSAEPMHAAVPLGTPTSVGPLRTPTRPKVRFGERLGGHRGARATGSAPEPPAEEVQQLSLF
jgi:RNA polymerase sigma factor (sigma-70 family)